MLIYGRPTPPTSLTSPPPPYTCTVIIAAHTLYVIVHVAIDNTHQQSKVRSAANDLCITSCLRARTLYTSHGLCRCSRYYWVQCVKLHVKVLTFGYNIYHAGVRWRWWRQWCGWCGPSVYHHHVVQCCILSTYFSLVLRTLVLVNAIWSLVYVIQGICFNFFFCIFSQCFYFVLQKARLTSRLHFFQLIFEVNSVHCGFLSVTKLRFRMTWISEWGMTIVGRGLVRTTSSPPTP